MLTDEDRQRIEAEERKRAAEEQYRLELRSKMTESASSAKRQRNFIAALVGICAGIVILAAFIVLSNKGQPSSGDKAAPDSQSEAAPKPSPKVRYVPMDEKIANGQITVRAGGYVQYRIAITPEMLTPTLSGSFNASGGSGNDISAVIADEVNYTNWINGHQARVFWGTAGKETVGNFEVVLPPGMYYLVFSNQFSVFTDKLVFVDVNLQYKKAETYY